MRKRVPFRKRAGSDLSRSIARALRGTAPGRFLADRIRRTLAVTEIEVPVGGLGPGLEGLRIAFLSDVHTGGLVDRTLFAEVVERTRAARPDLVLVGGDLVEGRLRDLAPWAAPEARLDAPLGVFVTPGNHDYHVSMDLTGWRRFVEGLGMRVLVNEGVRLRRGGDRLWLAGVDDLVWGEPDAAAALAGRERGEPAVLVSHNPDHFPAAADAGADLVLAGHTHGGQIRIFGRAPVNHTRYGYVAGHFRREESHLYVGRGIGTSLIPFRIGSPPEIPLVTLVRAASAGGGPDAARGNVRAAGSRA